MKQLKLKLLMAGVSLVLALTMISVGTFAWYTISRKAQVSGISITLEDDGKNFPFELSLDGTNWTTELHVDSRFGVLRPISTYDGVHWYLPNYSSVGSVNGFREVRLQDVSNRVSAPGVEETGNYLNYFDIWIRTRDPDTGYALKLNNPNKTGSGYHVEDFETVYGTYVLWAPQWSGGRYVNPTSTNDAMASLRVGFGILDDQDNMTKFVIYEPNADLRSHFLDGGFEPAAGSGTKEELGTLDYLGQGTSGGTKVGSYDTGRLDNTFYSTQVPQFTAGTDGGEDSYTMVDQPTLRQKASSWNTDKIAALTTEGSLNSRCIRTIGDFVNSSGQVVAYSQLESMAVITEGTPQKIRVFIWIEGQDVDCWNQISDGSIFANFEFRGDPVPNP